MTDDQQSPVRTGARSATEDGPRVRRPDEDIRRPRLRVKRKEEREGADPVARPTAEAASEENAQPAPEQGTDAAPADAAQEPASAQSGPPRHVPPPAGDDDPRFRYATYRAAPADEPPAKWAWLTSLVTRDGTGEISTGFVLGVALVLVVLIGGIWLSHLGNKVGRLEQRLTQLEQAAVTTADARELLP